MTHHERFADSVIEARTHLTDLWTQSVRQDPRIRSDEKLTESELIDHVPLMLDELAALLRSGETPSLHDAREARVHVYLRLRKGYRARDLVRELSLLRLVVLDYLSAVPATQPGMSLSDHAAAARIVNLYLDEEMRYAISAYTESDSASESNHTPPKP